MADTGEIVEEGVVVERVAAHVFWYMIVVDWVLLVCWLVLREEMFCGKLVGKNVRSFIGGCSECLYCSQMRLSYCT